MKYNPVLSLLKIAACSGVVALHFGRGFAGASLSVPVFMAVALYLSAAKLTGGGGLAQRIWRIYKPFLGWGILYFIVFSIMERKCDLMILLSQLTLGVPACPPLYFMMLLIASTITIAGCLALGRACVPLRAASGAREVLISDALLVSVFVACLFLQYSGVNHRLFASLSLYPQTALGRFVELLPAAILGYWLWQLRERRRSVGLVAALSLTGFASIKIFNLNLSAPGFSYSGISLLLGTVALLSIAILLGENKEAVPQGQLPDAAIKGLANLTAGIYYIHILVGKAVELPFGRHRGWLEAFAVFVLSAGCVWLVKRSKRLAWLVK